MKPAPAIYLRTSTTHQTAGSQEESLRQACASRGIDYDACTIYRDDATSGTRASRTGIDALMRDCEAGKVSMVVAFKLDRLGRSLAHLAQLLIRLSDMEVPLWIPSQGIDTSSANPAAKLQMHVLAAVAEFEREVIRERVKAGLDNARARGVRLGRRPGATVAKSKARRQGEALIERTELGDREIAAVVGVTRQCVHGWRRALEGFSG
jgi:DNA invertase Pin-like site-specific DNA recombinase